MSITSLWCICNLLHLTDLHPHSRALAPQGRCCPGRRAERSAAFSRRCRLFCSRRTPPWRLSWSGWRPSCRARPETWRTRGGGGRASWAAAPCCSSRAACSSVWSPLEGWWGGRMHSRRMEKMKNPHLLLRWAEMTVSYWNWEITLTKWSFTVWLRKSEIIKSWWK